MTFLRWFKDNEMVNAIYIYDELLRWFKDNEMVNAIYIYNELLDGLKIMKW